MDVSFSKLQEIIKDREVWRAEVHSFAKIVTGFMIEQQQQHLLSCILFFSSLFWMRKDLMYRVLCDLYILALKILFENDCFRSQD